MNIDNITPYLVSFYLFSFFLTSKVCCWIVPAPLSESRALKELQASLKGRHKSVVLIFRGHKRGDSEEQSSSPPSVRWLAFPQIGMECVCQGLLLF